eukprot:TRINITY_DN6601_c1_g5_i1.p1 TRINITY_DN6601_c1_g5~~TRINITY_DN6601_c1_g5_i1.p1  ORF type:complete len:440 (+),score=174.08 TRINITY_DN6601_c1_g5_i1:191-1510(+)
MAQIQQIQQIQTQNQQIQQIQQTLKYPNKPSGYEFYRQVLKSPKLVVAPMVDQSELAWRALSRKYGAELCYTPMFHSRLFSESENYRKENFQTDEYDRPLIVQFCSNDPQHFVKAAEFIQDNCDAIDLNLGCPQNIARRGHYGSYLQDEWTLIENIVSTAHKTLKVPITCKIRVFKSLEKTIQYAKMLERAGCQMLTVHGRTREQKGHKTGLADWNAIKTVKENVSIPVIANGNILYYEDIENCLNFTGVDGVMTAEGNLYNPALFTNKLLPCWQVVDDYLALCLKYPTNPSYIRGHLFKIYKNSLTIHTNIRDKFIQAKILEDYIRISNEFNEILKREASEFESKGGTWEPKTAPHWICQPYIRPPWTGNCESKNKKESIEEQNEDSIESKQNECSKRTSEQCEQQITEESCNINNEHENINGNDNEGGLFYFPSINF